MGKLRLFEIGCDPNIVERQNVDNILSDTNVLSYPNSALAHSSCHWRTDYRVAEVEFRLGELELSARDFGVRCLRVGVVVGTRSCGQRLGQI